MKKDDLYQWNKHLKNNSDYFTENKAMLQNKTYQLAYRKDKLTTLDNIKREHFELTNKINQNEQAKIEMEQAAARAAAEKEREEFETWKREKNKTVTD